MVENNELLVKDDREDALGEEVTLIEKKAKQTVIQTDDDFAEAGNTVKAVKAAQKKVDEYWEPMRESTYSAYKTVMAHKKQMSDPLKNAEKILKYKMSDYQVRMEKKRREEEEKLREMARKELSIKLAEAAEAEASGDAFGAEYAMAEAEALDTMAETVHVAKTVTQVDGIRQAKTWAIKNIDLSKLPDEFEGVVIRPADEKAIMRIIKESKGNVSIPGVEYEETVSFSVRVS